jgi:hypothetical protein
MSFKKDREWYRAAVAAFDPFGSQPKYVQVGPRSANLVQGETLLANISIRLNGDYVVAHSDGRWVSCRDRAGVIRLLKEVYAVHYENIPACDFCGGEGHTAISHDR